MTSTGAETDDPQLPDVHLRPARQTDWEMIRGWLGRPDVARWWGPKAASEASVILAMSSAHALCRIIEVAGQAVGYAHAVDATLWGEALPDELAPGSWDVDVLIAVPQMRNRGIGARALAAIRDEVFATTLAVEVCTFTSLASERAVRACEQAGFRWRRVWHDPVAGPCWLMTSQRPGMEGRARS